MGGVGSVRKIDLLSEVGEVTNKDLNLFVEFDGETTMHEIGTEDGKLVLVSHCEGGHVQCYADLEKLLEYMAINYPELYMNNVTSKMMRDYT